MEKLFLQIGFAVTIMILCAYFIYQYYSNFKSKDEYLSVAHKDSSELSNMLDVKSELKYHITWALHSGDVERFNLLTTELTALECQISELK